MIQQESCRSQCNSWGSCFQQFSRHHKHCPVFWNDDSCSCFNGQIKNSTVISLHMEKHRVIHQRELCPLQMTMISCRQSVDIALQLIWFLLLIAIHCANFMMQSSCHQGFHQAAGGILFCCSLVLGICGIHQVLTVTIIHLEIHASPLTQEA